VIKQGIVVGKDVVIGAGTVVITNIPDGKTVVGNPGRII
jgi:acetyltransferase-like isoleucine patch superfamily enzyme